MNNKRRKELSAMISIIAEIQSHIGRIRDDEEAYRDNIPENLRESERYERADNAVWALDDACYAFEEIIEHIGCAIE